MRQKTLLQSSSHQAIWAAAACATLCIAAAPASAQSVSTPPAPSEAVPPQAAPTQVEPSQTTAAQSNGPALQEIVVTAQRRTENLQNVPLSAQVVTGASLATANINDLNNLSQIAPGIHVSEGARSSDLYVRGVGSGENQSFDQSVATFVDDVYFGRSRTTIATFMDVDNVELLKGPQTTYFGNNAIAGAINVVTRQPSQKFDADARVLYGEYGQYAAEVGVGGPVTDTLSVRGAVLLSGQSGYLTNTATGRSDPADNDYAVRLSFKYVPRNDFDATLKVETSKSRDEGASSSYGQAAVCPPPAPFTAAGFCKTEIAEKLPIGVNNDKTAFPSGTGFSLDSTDAALTAHYRVLGQTITSVTGLYGYHFGLQVAANETESNGPALFAVQAPEHYQQFSQEFRIASPSGGRFEYLAGFYYQADELAYSQFLNFAFLTPALPAAFTPLGEGDVYRQREDVYSAFGLLTWNITDALKLTGALRATEDNKGFNYQELFGTTSAEYGGLTPFSGALCTTTTPATGLQASAQKLGLGAACAFTGSRNDKALLPSARIQYQITPTVMSYFSFNRGFLAGGFNGADSTGNINNLAFTPEYVNAYEVGIKSQLLHNRVRINADLFRENYSNLQVASTIASGNSVSSLVNNAAQSTSQGAEGEVEFAATSDFHLSVDVTWLDSHYDTYTNAPLTALQTFCHTATNRGNSTCVADLGGTGDPGASQNLSGRPTNFSPRWSGSVTASYTKVLPGDFRATVDVSPYLTTGYFLAGGEDDPFLHQPGYIRLDAKLTVDSPDRRWGFDIIGKNITDRTILLFGVGQPASLGSFIYGKEMPSNVVAQVRYHW